MAGHAIQFSPIFISCQVRKLQKKSSCSVLWSTVLVTAKNGPVGDPGEGVRLQGTVRDGVRKALEMEHLSLLELC